MGEKALYILNGVKISNRGQIALLAQNRVKTLFTANFNYDIAKKSLIDI